MARRLLIRVINSSNRMTGIDCLEVALKYCSFSFSDQFSNTNGWFYG